MTTKNEKRNTNRKSMKTQAKKSTGDNRQGRNQDPRTKWKTRDSRRDFQMARSVLIRIKINVFLSCLFSVSAL